MELEEYKQWVVDFYKRRDWYHYDAFTRICFLSEEVGEVSRAIRSLEIGRDRPDETELSQNQLKDNLMEELGDVIDNVLILADKYDLNLSEIMTAHQRKLKQRFEEEK